MCAYTYIHKHTLNVNTCMCPILNIYVYITESRVDRISVLIPPIVSTVIHPLPDTNYSYSEGTTDGLWPSGGNGQLFNETGHKLLKLMFEIPRALTSLPLYVHPYSSLCLSLSEWLHSLLYSSIIIYHCNLWPTVIVHGTRTKK